LALIHPPLVAFSGPSRPEVEAPVPVERDTEEVAAKGAGAARWWKLPLDALRVWALRVATSAWSVPFAIALLGFAILGRRLYRMRRQTKVTPFLFFVNFASLRPNSNCTN
jgi:hypothetical protein